MRRASLFSGIDDIPNFSMTCKTNTITGFGQKVTLDNDERIEPGTVSATEATYNLSQEVCWITGIVTHELGLSVVHGPCRIPKEKLLSQTPFFHIPDLISHMSQLSPFFLFSSFKFRIFLSLDSKQLFLQLHIALKPNL